MPRPPRVAFVVQRYGLEVCGGAELHCRYIAERLARHCAVEVLTTCARESQPWDNHYPPGPTTVNGVAVRRFALDRLRRHREFDPLQRKVLGGPHTDWDELEYVRALGPHSAALLAHLAGARAEHDVFVFFAYQYFPTVFGLPLAPEKAVLVPLAHDDPALRLAVYDPVFRLPRLILYNSDAERDTVEWRYPDLATPGLVVGTGVEGPPRPPDAGAFRRRHGLTGPFVLSVGRIEPAKGSQDLLDHFARYKAARGGDLKLVLIGRASMPLPRRPDVLALGFVSDEEKLAGLAAATVVALPAEHESLSMVNLEAWLMARPVLANGRCRVLRENCLRANGGLYYTSHEEFAAALDLLLADAALRRSLGEQGQRYFAERYSWEAIERKYLAVVGALAEG